MKFFDKKAEQFFYDYLNNVSPTGHEMRGQDIWMNYVTGLMSKGDDFITDPYGGVAAVIKGSSDAYKVVIEAHADEISWMVHNIDKEGYITVVRNGGSDPLIAPNMRVHLHGFKGVVNGFFGSPAIHVRAGGVEDKAAKTDELFIDIGAANKEEVHALGIDIGTTITYADGVMELGPNYFTGRGLDDRLCGFMNTQILRELKKQKIKLPYTLYIVNSVQEEVGFNGARLMADRIKPDLAICMDVCHDTQTKGYSKAKQGDIYCGKGPVISYSAPLHRMVNDFLVKTAEKNKIPFQKRAIQDCRISGTDTDAFAYSNGGVPSSLISLAQKYMHTSNETVHRQDIANAQDLLFKTLQNITGKAEQFDYYAKERKQWRKQQQT